MSTRASVTSPIASPIASRTVAPVASPIVSSRAAPVSAPVSSPVASPVASSTHRISSSRRPRPSSATVLPTPTPYDASSERRADTQRTNKILIGIFTGLGVVLLALVAFQLFRRYKRRPRANGVPLPPPRKSSMSQVGYRNSRAVSVYANYPSPDISRPTSVLMHKDNPFGSGSGIVTRAHSNAASVEVFGTDDTARRSAEALRQPGHVGRESTSDASMTAPALTPSDEEAGRRPSPLGSRSESPSGLTPPHPASQGQTSRRPESRNLHPRPTSAASAYLNVNRNSAYGAPNRSSYYGNGNHGAPHSSHARERVGLVMPQPLAPELFNYALDGRHDMGLDFAQGAWGSRGSLAKNPSRPDSWVGPAHSPSPDDTPAAPLPPAKSESLPRGRSS